MGKNSCPLSMSSNPDHPRRKPGMVMCIYNPSIERQRQTDPKKPHDQPRQNKLQDTVTRQKRKEKKTESKSETCDIMCVQGHKYIHTTWHTHVHTCTHHMCSRIHAHMHMDTRTHTHKPYVHLFTCPPSRPLAVTDPHTALAASSPQFDLDQTF